MFVAKQVDLSISYKCKIVIQRVSVVLKTHFVVNISYRLVPDVVSVSEEFSTAYCNSASEM